MMQHIHELQTSAEKSLHPDVLDYLESGCDDSLTARRNRSAFQRIHIRARYLVDVSDQALDTTVELFGRRYKNPVFMAPVGHQALFWPAADIATARAAEATGNQLIAATYSSFPIDQIARELRVPPWFQLYPASKRDITAMLLDKATAAGCEVVVLTVDAPQLGNRSQVARHLFEQRNIPLKYANFANSADADFDPSLTWQFIDWFRKHASQRLLLKGITTGADALRAIAYGADGVIVSNHGGRQLDSGLAALDSLLEIMDVVGDRIPVLMDGGIMRGTDVFKCLALGARAVCVGRAYIYGLATAGEAGVVEAMQILNREFLATMRLAGTPTIADIQRDSIGFKRLFE